MELTFVAVKDIWQLQPSWLHPCNVCDQGPIVGKIKFTRNRKMVGGWGAPRNFWKKGWYAGRLNGAFLCYLKRCFGSWDRRETFENKDANWCILTFCLILKRCKMRCRFIII